MIQRIQTLYLLLSVILGIICLSMPLGHTYTADGEKLSDLYNLWVQFTDKGGPVYTPWVLFALLVGVTTLTLLDIFLFKRRALQMRVITFCMILLIGYYVVLGLFVYLGGQPFRPTVTAAFPFVCIVLDYLAFRGILKDEMLVRSLDRLR